jgi:hypothetical protein
MTAVLTVTCDRCDQVIDQDRHLLLVTSGSLRQRRTEGVDLCPTCFAAFDQWLACRPGDRVAVDADGPGARCAP